MKKQRLPEKGCNVNNNGTRFPKSLFIVGLAALSAFLVGLPSFFAFFDPQEFMTFINPIEHREPLGSYLLNAYSWIHDGVRVGFIRPLTALSFFAEYPVFGRTAWLYRAVNLLIHGLACLLLFKSFCVLNGRQWILPAAAAAVAPGTVTALWFIAARGDVLAGTLIMASFFWTLKLKAENPDWRNWLLPIVFSALGLASKELGAAAFPVILLALILAPSSHGVKFLDRKGVIPLLVGLSAIVAVYTVARIVAFGNLGGYANARPFSNAAANLQVLIMQSSGAWLIQSRLLRLIYLVLVHLPMVLFAFSSSKSFRLFLLLLLTILLCGFQTIVGAADNHYSYAPSLIWTLMFFTSLAHFGRNTPVIILGSALILVWVLLSLQASRFNRLLAEPFYTVYSATSEIHPSIEGWDLPITILLGPDPGPGEITRELRNFPLFLSSFREGIPLEEGSVEIVTEPPPAGVPHLIWNGCKFTIAD